MAQGLTLALPLIAAGQGRPIDTAQSKLTVYVYKSGLFSAFADDHVIDAPIAAGTLSGSPPLSVSICQVPTASTARTRTLESEHAVRLQGIAVQRGPSSKGWVRIQRVVVCCRPMAISGAIPAASHAATFAALK